MQRVTVPAQLLPPPPQPPRGGEEKDAVLRFAWIRNPAAAPHGVGVVLRAQSIAGPLHLFAGAVNAVRDAKTEEDASRMLATGLDARKRGMKASEAFFLAAGDEGETDVVVARVGRDGQDSDENAAFAAWVNSFRGRVQEDWTQFGAVVNAHELQKRFELAPRELADMDRAVATRVAARDCM